MKGRSALGRQDESILVDFEMETEITGAERKKTTEMEARTRTNYTHDVFDFDLDTSGAADIGVEGQDDYFTFDGPVEPWNDTGFTSDSEEDDPPRTVVPNPTRTPDRSARAIPLSRTVAPVTPPPLPKSNTDFTVLNNSSSDESDVDCDDEGDYTGKFRTLVVPTKVDSPKTMAEERAELDWDIVGLEGTEGTRSKRRGKRYSQGSPHPKRFGGLDWSDEEDQEQEEEVIALEKMTHDAEGGVQDDEFEQVVGNPAANSARKGRRLTLSDIEKSKFGGANGEVGNARDESVDEEEAVSQDEEANEMDMQEEPQVMEETEREEGQGDRSDDEGDMYVEEPTGQDGNFSLVGFFYPVVGVNLSICIAGCSYRNGDK